MPDHAPAEIAYLLDAMAEAVMATDADGSITLWNRQSEAIYGWSRDEAIGRNMGELLTGMADREGAARLVASVLRGNEWEGDGVVRRRDGTSFLANVRTSPIRDANGAVTGMVMLSKDVTEARALERVRAEAVEAWRPPDEQVVEPIIGMVRPLRNGELEWIYTNEAWQQLLGDPQKLRRAGLSPAYHADDMDQAELAAIRESVLSGKTESREVRLRDPEGNYRWFRVRLIPGTLAGGKTGIVTLVGVDVDHEHQVAQAQEQRNAILRRLADAVPALLAVSIPVEGQGTRMLFLNKRWQEYTGLSEDQLLDEDARRETYHPDDRERVPALRESIANVDRVDGEFRFRRADGAYRWHRVVHQVVRRDDGKTLAFVMVAIDIHESHEAARVRARLAAIVDSSSDAIVSKSLDGIITSWNAGAQQLYGYTAEEAIGKPMDLYIPDDQREQMNNFYARVREGENPEPFETVRIAKDGRRFPVSLTVSPMVDAEGNVVGASAIARDITEEKRMVDALRRANAIKEEFLSLVSHELRTPLTTVVGLAHVLARRADRYDEETRGIHNDLFRESARLQAIIENMLMLTRLDSEPVGLDPVPVERLIERVASRFTERGPASKVEVELEDNLPLIAGQEGWLEQILENLLSNADKYSPAGGRIVLSASCRDNSVIVRVRDYGPGIPEDDQPYIFEAFFRSRSTSGVPGAGLGLAVCKRLAELQEGEIRALSADGGGTIMELKLRVAEAHVNVPDS